MAPKVCMHPFLIVVGITDQLITSRCTNPRCELVTTEPYPSTRKKIEGQVIRMYSTEQEQKELQRSLRFFVIGAPAPQGSKRAFTPKGGGFTRLIEVSKKVGPWRDSVAASAIEAANTHGWKFERDAPISIDVTFWLPAPKSTKRLYPSVKPDIDKLMRSTYDGLTMSGAIMHDDSQIVDGSSRKRYVLPGLPTGAVIIIDRLED